MLKAKAQSATDMLLGEETSRRWRVCAPQAMTDGEHTFVLLINNYTGMVRGYTDKGRWIDVTDNLTDLIPFIDDAALIKRARIVRGFTQDEVAHYLQVTTQTVRNWEAGARRPAVQYVKRLQMLLNIELGM